MPQTGRINGPALATNLLREGIDFAIDTDLLVFDVTGRILTTAGRLNTSASTTARAGFNIAEGVAPTVPVDGDTWIDAAGNFFMRLNGSTLNISTGIANPGSVDGSIQYNAGLGSFDGIPGFVYDDTTLGFDITSGAEPTVVNDYFKITSNQLTGAKRVFAVASTSTGLTGSVMRVDYAAVGTARVLELNANLSSGDILALQSDGTDATTFDDEGWLSLYPGSPGDGEVLTWVNANGRYEPVTLGLASLSDVVSATNTDTFALMANGTTGYVGRALVEADISDLGTYAEQLSELSDVVSATNTNQFALMANGTTGYVGRALLEADISDLAAYAEQLSELSDVVSATNTNRFVLVANGTTGYVGRALLEADISDLTHVDAYTKTESDAAAGSAGTKIDKVSGDTTGNFAEHDGSGELQAGTSKSSDFATAAQGTTADSAQQVVTATTAELTDITDIINTDPMKVAGWMVFNTTTGAPVWAIADTDGGVWNDATGTLAHTPV